MQVLGGTYAGCDTADQACDELDRSFVKVYKAKGKKQADIIIQSCFVGSRSSLDSFVDVALFRDS